MTDVKKVEEARQWIDNPQVYIPHDIRQTLRAHLSTMKSCSGCLGGTIHHTCGKQPDAYANTLSAEDVKAIREILERIEKRPDLPNPDRDADWKNCQKWSSADAKEALSILGKVA